LKFIAISTPHDAAQALKESLSRGYYAFVYKHADPKRELQLDKFLYVDTDAEVIEKMALLKSDITAHFIIS
jgi:hypothetical protein